MFKFFTKKNPPVLVSPEPDKYLWKCRDGSKILVKDMTDSHLINTHAMFKKYAIAWAVLEKELIHRSLQAKTVQSPKTTIQKRRVYRDQEIFGFVNDDSFEEEF